MSDQLSPEAATPPPIPRRRRLDVRDPLVKLCFLAALALLTLVPASLISGLVDERMSWQSQARNSVTRSWGPEQTLSRFALALPKTVGDGTPRYISLIPDALDATVEMTPEQRRRGFFTTTVYAAKVHLRGTFVLPREVRFDTERVPLPEQGVIVANLSGLNGVESSDKVTFDGKSQAWQVFEPRNAKCAIYAATLAVPVTLAKGRDTLAFEADLHLRGTEALRLAQLAKGMDVTIKGAWPSPSFVGDEAPLKTSVQPNAFNGHWRLDSLGTSQAAVDECAARELPAVLGVSLVDPMPIYRMVTRAAKYGLLFVVLAFTAYFAFELAAGVAIGVLQYGLLAASLTLFPLLLVSIGEVSSYTTGYVVAAVLVVAQASIFTLSVMRRFAPALGFATLLTGLFGFLYVLLGLENFALLIGAVGLFVVLSVVMALTQAAQRRVARTA